MGLAIGDKVTVHDEKGVVRHIGYTRFAPGVWYGIELNEPRGKNNGTVQGVRYFDCTKEGLYGVFVRENLVKPDRADEEGGDEEDVTRGMNGSISSIQKELELKTNECKELKQKAQLYQADNGYLHSLKSELEAKLNRLTKEHALLLEKHAIAQEELEISHELDRELKQAKVSDYSLQDLQRLAVIAKDSELSLQRLESELKEKQAEATQLADQLEQSSQQLAKLKMAVSEKEADLVSLKERLESFADLEAMAEQLSLENDNLKKAEKELRNAVQEMNEIHALDKILEEQHIEVEKQLKSELQQLQSLWESEKEKCRDLETEIQKAATAAAASSAAKPTPRTPKTRQVCAEFDTDQDQESLLSLLSSLREQLDAHVAKSKSHAIRFQLLQQEHELVCERLSHPTLTTLNREYVDLIFNLRTVRCQLDVVMKELAQAFGKRISFLHALGMVRASISVAITALEFNYGHESLQLLIESSAQAAESFKSLMEQIVESLLEGSFESDEPELYLKLIADLEQSRLMQLWDVLSRGDVHFNASKALQIRFISAMLDNLTLYGGASNEKENKDASVQKLQTANLDSVAVAFKQKFAEVIDDELADLEMSSNFSIVSLFEIFLDCAKNKRGSKGNENNKSDSLERLHDALAGMDLLISNGYTVKHHLDKCVYDMEVPPQAVPKPATESQVTTTATDKAHVEYIIQQKEEQIRDFKLNISLLEQNMKQISKMASKEVDISRSELAVANREIKEKNENISRLETEKLALRKHLEIAQEEALLLHSSASGDIKSQEKYQETVSRLERLVDLRAKAKQKQKQKTDGISMWSGNKKLPRWKETSNFQNLSRSLRNLAEVAEPIEITSSNRPTWTRKRSLPSYINSVLTEQYIQITRMQKDII